MLWPQVLSIFRIKKKCQLASIIVRLKTRPVALSFNALDQACKYFAPKVALIVIQKVSFLSFFISSAPKYEKKIKLLVFEGRIKLHGGADVSQCSSRAVILTLLFQIVFDQTSAFHICRGYFSLPCKCLCTQDGVASFIMTIIRIKE